MCFIDKYIIVLSFLLRPSSHGTEQNMGDPWREEAAVKSYITIPTLFTVQSFSSVRHGKEVYRLDDVIWLIDLICTVSVLHLQGSTHWKYKCDNSGTARCLLSQREGESRCGTYYITVAIVSPAITWHSSIWLAEQLVFTLALHLIGALSTHS